MALFLLFNKLNKRDNQKVMSRGEDRVSTIPRSPFVIFPAVLNYLWRSPMVADHKILFVDDEENFASMMAAVLEKEGFDVDIATRAETAFSMFKSEKYDLVVTDINMPGMDGIELIRKIHEIDEDQRVVVITGFPSHDSQSEAFKLGSVNYLVKPFLAERFIEVVNNSLNNHSQTDELVGPVKITCEDLLQMYALEQKKAILEIHNGAEIGYLYFQDGKIVHAETSDHKGEEAFYQIQTWKGGRFDTKSLRKNIPHTIDKNVHTLLLEGAKRLDDLNNGSKKGSKKRKKTQRTKEERMPSKAQQIIEAGASELDGLVSVQLVGMDGIAVAEVNPSGAPADVYSAKFALVMTLINKTLKDVGAGGVDENLIEHSNGWFLSRMVGNGQYYLGISVTKSSVLGNVRMVAKKIADELSSVVG